MFQAMPTWTASLTNQIETQGRARLLVLVCFVAFSVPFLFGYGTAPLTNFAGEIVSAAGFAMLLVASLQYGNLDARSRGLHLVLCALGILGAVSAAQYLKFGSNNSSTWLMAVCYFALAGVSAWIGHSGRASADPEVWIHAIATALVAGALLAACASIAQYFGLDGSTIVLSPSIDAGRTFGFVRQPNHQGTFLSMGLTALLASQFYLKRRIWKWLAIVVSPVLAFGIVSTGSRTALLQLVLVSTVWCALALKNKRSVVLSALPLASAALIWSTLYVLALQGQTSFYGAEKLAQTSSEGLGMRTQMWKQTILLILERPWFGHGIVQYVSTFYLSGAAEHVGLIMSNSHNLLLQLLFAFGIPATVLVILCIAYVLWSARHRFWSIDGAFAFTVLGCIGIHSIFEFPMWYLYFLLPAGLCVGWLCFSPPTDASNLVGASVAETPAALRMSSLATRLVATSMSLAMMLAIAWINHDYYRLTPVYTAGLKITLETRLREANRVFWFRPFADFLMTFNEMVDASNAKRYVDSAAKIGCVMHEIWYQPRTIVALLYVGRVDDAKSILYSFWKLSGGNMKLFEAALSVGDIPHAKEMLQYIENPTVAPKSLTTFTETCFGSSKG